MLTIYVINLKTKTVVYHGTLEQCNSILKKYSQRRYFLAILNTIPSTYVHTYELNSLEKILKQRSDQFIVDTI